MFLFSIIAGLLLVAIFSIFIFNRWRVTQKQKKIIEIQKQEVDEQKKIVEEKNKDITDSINYAQRIQRALLASDSLLNKNLRSVPSSSPALGAYRDASTASVLDTPAKARDTRTDGRDYFVLFKPKDIVSGDFYWAVEKDNRFYLAVCDSTGHGVPGAFMSLLNISFLNEAITEKGISQPNEIFNHVRQRLIENLSSEGAKDGMDGILLCLTTALSEGEEMKIEYAAANNAPVLINGSFQKLDKDNMPVGLGEKKDSFKLRSILPPSGGGGAVLYLYTDGFADQFGGPKEKKFKYKQLNELLSANSNKPLAEQKTILEKAFEDWKGNLEQVDDVLVIGIKI